MSLQPINISDKTKADLCVFIPDSIIKQRDSGKVSLSYISGSTVIDILNKAFNYLWDFEPLEQWVEPGVPYFNKYSKEVDKWENQAPSAHVKGKLTVYLQDEKGQIQTIVKTAFGSKAIIGKQSEQESIFKSAATDALKKAASHLGIGLQLYRNEEDSEFFYDLCTDNYESDEWSDETIALNEDNLSRISEAKDQYDEVEFNTLLNEAAGINSIEEVSPSNINAVVEFLDALERVEA